jgi:hypothetical protein
MIDDDPIGAVARVLQDEDDSTAKRAMDHRMGHENDTGENNIIEGEDLFIWLRHGMISSDRGFRFF